MGIDCVASEAKSAGSQGKVKNQRQRERKQCPWINYSDHVENILHELFSIETGNFYALFQPGQPFPSRLSFPSFKAFHGCNDQFHRLEMWLLYLLRAHLINFKLNGLVCCHVNI